MRALFSLYKPQGFVKALWTVLRIWVLPYRKLDSLIPESGRILDIGCGNGGFSNYVAICSQKRKVTGIDLSKERISDARKSVSNKSNINFRLGDILSANLPRSDCYLMVDVLHHISFKNQEKMLHFLAKKLNKKSVLIIKEVDPSNKLPFAFGHLIEKVLYPNETIYARSKGNWKKLFDSLGLKVKIYSGSIYFPDSTLIYILTAPKKHRSA